MSNRNIFSTLIVTWVAVPSLAMFLGAGPARAQNNTSNYTFLVASGFLVTLPPVRLWSGQLTTKAAR
jgi:hypothetical protein